MRFIAVLCIAATTMLASGCASNAIVGHGAVQSGRYQGEVGISGNGSTVTIEKGSLVSKLSIVGDGCKVTVEDGAEIRKIEFWGNGSTVTIPQDSPAAVAAMGTNQVIRRSSPAGTAPAAKP